MERTLEERFGLDGARIMESQSEMLFKARREVCNLHLALEAALREKKDIENDKNGMNKLIESNNECFAYAIKMFNYVCEQQKILVGADELYAAIGVPPVGFNEYKNTVLKNK